jgi:hypothetical protein
MLYFVLKKIHMLYFVIKNRYNMLNQGFVRKSVFSFWLNRKEDENEGGEIVFGGVDKKHINGEHTFVPLISITQAWAVGINKHYTFNMNIEIWTW